MEEDDKENGCGNKKGKETPPSGRIDAVFVDVEVEVEIEPMSKELKALEVLDRSFKKQLITIYLRLKNSFIT